MKNSQASTIVKWLESRGHMARKYHVSTFTQAGEADIDVWFYFGGLAIPCKLEIKRHAKDRPTAIQEHKLQLARDHGIGAFVVWEMEQVKRIERFYATLFGGKHE